jgi:hypothetical protein
MKVFLSYPRTESDLAADLVARLKSRGHEVFFDAHSLPPSESYDDLIREQVEEAELFVSLMSGDSLRNGTYSRTEVKFAEQKWPNPDGHVLPVAVNPEAMDHLPPYLKSVTVMSAQGELVAEVVAEVDRIANKPRRRIMQAVKLGVLVLAIAGIAWLLRASGIDPGAVELSTTMKGTMYTNETLGKTQQLEPTTPYHRALDAGLNGTTTDGEKLYWMMEEDIGGTYDEEGNSTAFPRIQFSMVNTSDDIALINRVRLEVAKSSINLQPLPWTTHVAPHTNMIYNAGADLGNQGWGDMTNTVLRFDLVAESDLNSASQNTERRFQRELGVIPADKIENFRFWDELGSLGSNIAFLRDGPHPYGDQAAMDRFARDVMSLKATLGAAPDEDYYLVGELDYQWGNGERSVLSLKQKLEIVYPGPVVAPAMMVLSTYDIKLRTEGENYVVEVPIEWSLAKDAAESFDLRVFVEKSSFHSMKASINVKGEGWVPAGGSLSLEYYVPQNAVWAIDPVLQE